MNRILIFMLEKSKPEFDDIPVLTFARQHRLPVLIVTLSDFPLSPARHVSVDRRARPDHDEALVGKGAKRRSFTLANQCAWSSVPKRSAVTCRVGETLPRTDPE